MDGYRIRIQRIEEGETQEDVMVFEEQQTTSFVDAFSNALQDIIPMVMSSHNWQDHCLSHVIVHLHTKADINGGEIDPGLVEAAWKYLKSNDIDPEV